MQKDKCLGPRAEMIKLLIPTSFILTSIYLHQGTCVCLLLYVNVTRQNEIQIIKDM